MGGQIGEPHGPCSLVRSAYARRDGCCAFLHECSLSLNAYARRDGRGALMQEIFGRADVDKDGFMSVDEYFAIHAEAEQNEPQ